jgi:hypothetical protein
MRKDGGGRRNKRVGAGACNVVGGSNGSGDIGGGSWLQLVVGGWGQCWRKRIRRDG